MRPGFLRRSLRFAAILLLAFAVVTLSIESRVRADATQRHLAKQCKFTDTSVDAPAALPAPRPAAVGAVTLRPDGIAPVLEGSRWEPAFFCCSHLLRAPPAA
jgi:hypothetical protein